MLHLEETIAQFTDASWALVDGSEGEYAVSQLGELFRLCGRPTQLGTPPYKMPINDNGYGYKVVSVRAHGQRKSNYVHRLVAEAFIPNPDNLGFVGHKDHDRSNNMVGNLYWTTASGNTKDGVRDGKINQKGRYKNDKMSLHSDQVLCQAYVQAKRTGEVTETGLQYGVNRTTLSSWLNKRSRTELTDFIDEMSNEQGEQNEK